MQTKTAFTTTSQTPRVHRIVRFCAIGLFLVLGQGCGSPSQAPAESAIVTAADLGAPARTDTGKANRARAAAESVTPRPSPIPLPAWVIVAAYNTIGNFAAFFEIGAAAHLDGTERRIWILPLVLGGFLVSLVSTSRAVLSQLLPRRSRAFHWDKTERFREDAPVPVFSAQPAMASSGTAPKRSAAIPQIPTPELAPAATHTPRRVRRPADVADRSAKRSTSRHQIRVPGKPTS
jgi:hypothetical protein